MMRESIAAQVSAQLATPSTAWSIGIFGAVAEFHRDPSESAIVAEHTVATGRGAIRVMPPASSSIEPFGRRRQADVRDYGVAVCLPEADARIGTNRVFTELGPDGDAVRAEDRGSVLFDLGLDTPYGMFCVRSPDPAEVAALRAFAGKRVLDPGSGLFARLVASSPHRVFISRVGRIEVFGPIPNPGGATPTGPHTHLLPKLLSRPRTHSANAILPEGIVPCATFYAAGHQAREDE